MGFANCYVHNELHPPDTFKAIYQTMQGEVGIRGGFQAPSTLGVWISEKGSLILVRKRGDWDSGDITIPNAEGSFYTQAVNMIGDGALSLKLDLRSGEQTAILERLGSVRAENPVEVRDTVVEGDRIARIEFVVLGEGSCTVTVRLWPRRSYRLRLGGEAEQIVTDAAGCYQLDMNLSGKHSLAFEATD